MSLIELKKEIKELAAKKRATLLARYFKARPGGYAEGDIFAGLTVPASRTVAKKNKNLSFSEIEALLKSKIHEERLIALLILVDKFKKSDDKEKKKIFNFYLANTKHINNWDLVDLSSGKIVGEYLLEKPHCTTTLQGLAFEGAELLYSLAKSANLWERRIAIISTSSFIKNNDYTKTLEVSKVLLNDKHDLIHKAVGWMLREVGKKSEKDLESFLKMSYKQMPRTMLRYAIEKFPEEKRLSYLHSTI